MKTLLTLVRHGRPDRADRLLGRTDPGLTPQGWQQMQVSCDGLEVDGIISSPLSRCAEFAHHLSRQRRLPLTIEPGIQELDFGQWDGVDFETLWQSTDGAFELYWQTPWQQTPPQGESTQALHQRVEQTLLRCAREHPGRHLLLLTHAGVMRVVLAWLLEGSRNGNAHLSRVTLGHGARLSLSLYQDEQGQIWPQLLELFNPEEGR
ncbi:histidine phosphatase family protein [Ferrimonas sediminicola]|uniref:Histidine phosphatase family protein n=1 Tax=Ferrimonas sediminicola TaxID=2569538 RepID=A0A4U1BGY1_9GAMM|nr:histidine phosphatase family protein [Ferrimonas sediminicola]TKB50277.1 histidine phosphatase family protein [Ferrimonas sediminicola]